MRFRKLFTAASLASVLVVPLLSVSPAHADSASITLNMSSGCVSTVSSSYIDVTPGASVTLTVTNNDNLIYQNYSGGGLSGQIQPNNQATLSLGAISSPTTITFTPVPSSDSGAVYTNYCPTSSSSQTASSFVINPAAATLACNLDGNKWDITGAFSGSSAGTNLYVGSSQLTTINDTTINRTQPASSTAQTFTIYDGATYGGKGTLLASATCPAYTAPAATPTDTDTSKTVATSTPAKHNKTGGTTTQVVATAVENTSARRKAELGITVCALVILLAAVALIWLLKPSWFAKLPGLGRRNARRPQ